jgi:hypothetical protein
MRVQGCTVPIVRTRRNPILFQQAPRSLVPGAPDGTSHSQIFPHRFLFPFLGWKFFFLKIACVLPARKTRRILRLGTVARVPSGRVAFPMRRV